MPVDCFESPDNAVNRIGKLLVVERAAVEVDYRVLIHHLLLWVIAFGMDPNIEAAHWIERLQHLARLRLGKRNPAIDLLIEWQTFAGDRQTAREIWPWIPKRTLDFHGPAAREGLQVDIQPVLLTGFVEIHR